MYWVDTLARDFIKLLKKPVALELSAEMPSDEKTGSLLKTVAYVSKHKLQAVLLLVHDAENAREILRYATKNDEFRNWLGRYKFTEMIRIVDYWDALS
jgi:hypothetical protein